MPPCTVHCSPTHAQWSSAPLWVSTYVLHMRVRGRGGCVRGCWCWCAGTAFYRLRCVGVVLCGSSAVACVFGVPVLLVPRDPAVLPASVTIALKHTNAPINTHIRTVSVAVCAWRSACLCRLFGLHRFCVGWAWLGLSHGCVPSGWWSCSCAACWFHGAAHHAGLIFVTQCHFESPHVHT